MKSIPAELSKPLTVEDVRKIFGFTQPEDLSELLKKCPRHYIRVRKTEQVVKVPPIIHKPMKAK